MSIFDWLTASKKQQQIERFMVKILNQAHLQESTHWQREEKRSPLSMGIRVTPVRDGRYDRGAAFTAVTRDATLTGLSFTHSRLFGPPDQLVISFEFERGRHHFLCEVRHCSPIGYNMFLTGCMLVEKVNETSELAP